MPEGGPAGLNWGHCPLRVSELCWEQKCPHSPQIKQRQAINSNYIPGMYIPCWPWQPHPGRLSPSLTDLRKNEVGDE